MQTEIVPQVSAKAKLNFEDAVKLYDEQKKSGKLDYAPLEKRFQAAVDADSSLAEADFNLGVLAEKQGKTKEAIGHYKDALRKKPTLRQAAENLAVIAQNQGDEAGAIKIYQQILATYPDDAVQPRAPGRDLPAPRRPREGRCELCARGALPRPQDACRPSRRSCW